MNPRLLSLLRFCLTAVVVLVAVLVATMLWKHYMYSPWTRDGRVRAEVVRIAPDVAGLVTEVVAHDELVEAQIPAERRGELCATEGKDWVLCKRNLLGPHKATTYGWHKLDGKPIQTRGSDGKAPRHNDTHFDYSQTLRPIQRMARRSDGTQVDLLDIFRSQGLPPEVLAPLRG